MFTFILMNIRANDMHNTVLYTGVCTVYIPHPFVWVFWAGIGVDGPARSKWSEKLTDLHKNMSFSIDNLGKSNQ